MCVGAAVGATVGGFEGEAVGVVVGMKLGEAVGATLGPMVAVHELDEPFGMKPSLQAQVYEFF